MKKLIIAISMFPICVSLAQTNWAFQWHGQERGIIFGQTNLSKNVKMAIRDDIAQVMSHLAFSDTDLYPARPNNPDYEAVDGLMNIRADGDTYPDNFPIGYYRVLNGMTNFVLCVEECSTYASAIALTNQHAAQISKLPIIIKQFTNGLDIANMTLKQKEAYIWHPYLDEQKKRNQIEYEEHISAALPKAANQITVFKPSVLAYSKEDIEENGKPLLVCKLYITLNMPVPPKSDTLTFVFRNGAWRWCPDIF